MLLGNVAVNGQPDETTDPRPIYIIQIEIYCPFSKGKCPSNIAQKVSMCIITFT